METNLGAKRANSITITPHVEGRRISYDYTVTGPWREVFNLDGIEGWFGKVSGGVHDFFVEYDEDVEAVPDSIAIIPMLCNVLPVAWIYDADVVVAELDEDFFRSIPGFQRGYHGMYPSTRLAGRLSVGRLVRNPLPHRSEESLLFFSGGVDASFTLLSVLATKPRLFTLWGSDIYFTHVEQWHAVSEQHRRKAEELGLAYSTVKSSFRFFLKSSALDVVARQNGTSSWWHGFQHGIGLISHAAPLAFLHGIRQVYIASSYSLYSDQATTCASWPTIDEFVRFSDCVVRHHDFSATRQDKVAGIVQMSRELGVPLHLRVCWEAIQSQNCCRCEKCVRTTLSLIAEGGDPAEFGFRTDADAMAEMTRRLVTQEIRPHAQWGHLIERLRVLTEPERSLAPVQAIIASFDQARRNGTLPG